LIGDDEHGWGSDGIFNFEGGCYAKCIKLSQEAEPRSMPRASARRVLENVVLNVKHARAGFRRRLEDREHRLAYPLDFIPNASRTGVRRIRRTS